MQRVSAVAKWSEHVRNVGMFHRFAGIVRHQVLFGNIGNIFSFLAVSASFMFVSGKLFCSTV